MKHTVERLEDVERHIITAESKGSVKISIFKNPEVNTKALFGISNTGGMSSFKNLLTKEDIEKEIEEIDEIKWLTEEEKSLVVEILETINPTI